MQNTHLDLLGNIHDIDIMLEHIRNECPAVLPILKKSICENIEKKNGSVSITSGWNRTFSAR